ncbi:MAG: hypothetical protein RIQ79_606 [Verrucomicrobiota bacterium]
MSGPAHLTEAHLLAKAPHTGDHLVLTCFSPTDGLLTALLRTTRTPKPDTATPPDLFDRLALTLQHGRNSPGDGPWFVKEHRLLARHAAIGRDYPTLAAASRLARLVSRNPVPQESRHAVDARLAQAFAALCRSGTRPELIYFKSLYCLARDEGLPLKQEWLPALPDADRERIAHALNQPAESPQVPLPELLRLTRHLEAYLAAEHDLVFDAA